MDCSFLTFFAKYHRRKKQKHTSGPVRPDVRIFSGCTERKTRSKRGPLLRYEQTMHIGTLQLQQCFFPLDATAIADKAAVCTHHTVARDHERDRVMPHRAAYRLRKPTCWLIYASSKSAGISPNIPISAVIENSRSFSVTRVRTPSALSGRSTLWRLSIRSSKESLERLPMRRNRLPVSE